MLGNSFRRSTYEKQRANKEKYLEINSAASSGRQKEMLASFGLRLREHVQFLHVSVFHKKNVSVKGSNIEGDCHQCPIKSSLKMYILINPFRSSVGHDVAVLNLVCDRDLNQQLICFSTV